MASFKKDLVVLKNTSIIQSKNKAVSVANAEETEPKAKPPEPKDLDAENATETETLQEKAVSEKPPKPQPTKIIHRAVKGQYDTCNREQLYKEVWAKPVIEVAAQYGVSDVMIHKIS